MVRTLEATLDPAGQLHFVEDVQLTKPQRVLVTLSEEDAASAHPCVRPQFRQRPIGSPAEIERVMQASRNAWEPE